MRGTDEEHGAGIDRLPLASARPKPGAAQRCRIRHRRRHKGVPGVTDRGRCGHRQDQDPRPSGRACDPEWRRSAAAAAADVHSARRARDDATSPPNPRRSSRRRRRSRINADDHPALVGNISFGRQPPFTAPRPSIGLDPSFTVLDRSDSADLLDLVRTELGLVRTASRFPRKGTASQSTPTRPMPGARSRKRLPKVFPGAPIGQASFVACSRPMSWPSSGTTSSITTTSCCTGASQWPNPPSERRSAAVSTTSSLTSTRTPIGSKPKSCWRCVRTGLDLAPSATTRNRSIRKRSEHSRLSPHFLTTCHGHRARAQLDLVARIGR